VNWYKVQTNKETNKHSALCIRWQLDETGDKRSVYFVTALK